MNTLNYWLGKLQRLQLFGHGVREIKVANTVTGELFEIVQVHALDGTVYIDVVKKEG